MDGPILLVRRRTTALLLICAAAATTSCRDPVRPPAAVVVEVATPAADRAIVGTMLSPPPAFVVRDANGKALVGVPVTITVTEGGGALTGVPTRTASVPTAVGSWTLGTHAGRNALSVKAGSLPPLIFAIDGIPDVPNVIQVPSGDGQSAFAGDALPNPITVRAVDRFGNGVPGVDVAFSVESGGGGFSPSSGTTNSDGAVSGLQWQLGYRGGAQRAVATAAGLSATLTANIKSDFTPDVRFFGPPPSAEIRAAFQTAADRLRASIVGDMEDVPLVNFATSGCGVPGPLISETVDDVIVYASIAPIDGPGKILGSAGPCMTRSGSGFTVIGVMTFDVDDMNALVASGRISAVITHEMMHVVGFGALWRARNLLQGAGGGDPYFSGPLALNNCLLSGGTAACANAEVPVENTGGSGTALSHWRESVFDSELMTGFAEPTPNMPLSTITLGSLQDIGHTVNYKAADPFVVPIAAARLIPGAPAPTYTPWEIVLPPRFEVTPGGWVRPVSWK